MCVYLVGSYRFSISIDMGVCFTAVCYYVTGKYNFASATFVFI